MFASMGFLVLSLIAATICGLAGSALLDSVEHGGRGFWLGFLLGPLGLVIAWAQRDDLKREIEERKRRHHSIDDAMANLSRPPRAFTAQPQAPPANVTAIEELERLAALREKGHVTEEEFNFRKRQLLGLPKPRNEPAPRRFR